MIVTTTAAAFILGFLVATMYGAGFHLAVGGRLRTILIYLVASYLGFLIGHVVGDFVRVDILRLGVLQLFTASVGAWGALLIAKWLVGGTPISLSEDGQ